MENFISIIIPIYDIDDGFQNSFNSLINQSYKYFEIIFVTNDKNNFSKLAEKTKEYDNIINICENFDNDAGAWNIGLKNSNGNYILFFNQNLIINEFTLEKFFWNVNIPFDIISSNYIGKNDLFYDYNENYLFKNLINCYENAIIDLNNQYKAIFKISNNLNSKLFNKDFLLKHNLIFETEFSFYQELFYYLACFKSSNILLINDSSLNLISFASNNVSITLDNFNDYLSLNKELLINFQENSLHEYFKNTFSQVLILNVLKEYNQLPENAKSKWFNLTKDLLLYSKEDILNDITPSFKQLFNNFINSNNSNEENILNFYFNENFKKKTKISVIIPIFKNPKYIHNCIESLLNQTLDDIEIICIEDRGKDESYDILKEFAKKDSRIKLRSNETSYGFGYSKNIGLNFAVGEFVLFIDVKNVLPSDKLEKIYYLAKQEQVDMLICPVVNGEDLINNFQKQIFDFKDVITNRELFKFLIFSTNVIYNSSFLKKINIKFNENIKLEDALFYIESLLNAKRVSIYHGEYPYLKNRHFNWKYNNQYFITFFNDVFNLFKEKGYFDKYKKNLFIFKIDMCQHVLNNIENKREYYELLHRDFKNFNFDYKKCLDSNQAEFVNIIKSKSYDKYSLDNAMSNFKTEIDELKNLNENLNNQNKQLVNSTTELNNTINKLNKKNLQLSYLNRNLVIKNDYLKNKKLK